MSGVAAGAAILGVALGVVGLAVAAGDRRTFVPPPEAVSESFVRQLAAKRYDRALPFLSESATARTNVANLRSLADELNGAVGGIANVEGTPVELGLERAAARARVVGRHRDEAWIAVRLSREHGLWKIDDWTW